MKETRHPLRIAAWIAAAALALLAVSAAAKPDPPKPPKPKVQVLTGTEEGALRKRAIKVRIESKRGEKGIIAGTLLVDGYPEDFLFKLGPKQTRLKRGEGTVSLGLSPRKREVLDFAIKTCRGATVEVTGRAAGRERTVSAALAIPADC